MPDLRHLNGSNPTIEVCDSETASGTAVAVHFEARPPKAPHSVEQEIPSVVIGSTPPAKDGCAEVTHVTRPRGLARWLSLKVWVIAVERHWVFIALSIAVSALLICAAKLHGSRSLIP